MSTPSLLNIPYLYKAGTLYSQIPESGAGDFTVTRATTPTAGQSTRINKNGLIELVADNVPRLDYPLGGAVNGCPALLVEPSAQNLLQRSEEFNHAYWGKASGGTASVPVVTPNVELAPDGTNNADRVVFALNNGTTSTDLSSINSATLTHSASSFTSSVYIRTTDGSTVTMTFVNADGTSTNRTITPTYQRITYTSTGAGTAQYRIRLRGGVTSDSASVAIWGAQYEAGSIATSYIPTTTAAITRGADVISRTSASALIGQSEGTIYAEVDVRSFVSSAARRIVNLRVDGSNLLSLEINTAGNQFDFVALSGGVGVTASASGITTGVYKIAVGYNSATNGTALYVNGTLRDTKTIAIPNLSAVVFGLGVRADGAAGTQLNDRIRASAIYPNRLTNAQLASLTAP